MRFGRICGGSEHWLGAIAVLWLVPGALSLGGSRETLDKSTFTFWDPTPPEHVREMTTDSHGATETPYTVDAGHFQVEMIMARYAYDQDYLQGQTVQRESWAVGPLLLKAGLYNAVDAELVLEPYHYVHERLGANAVTLRGIGDTTLRFKANLWGNDEGATALALVPYVTFPTRAEELGEARTQAGFSLPFSGRIAKDWYLDLTARVGLFWNELDQRYDTDFSQSISLGHSFSDRFYGYVELFSAVSTGENVPWVGTVDTGLVFSLSPDLQLNAGLNIGITRSAEDWSPFLGVAWRY